MNRRKGLIIKSMIVVVLALMLIPVWHVFASIVSERTDAVSQSENADSQVIRSNEASGGTASVSEEPVLSGNYNNDTDPVDLYEVPETEEDSYKNSNDGRKKSRGDYRETVDNDNAFSSEKKENTVSDGSSRAGDGMILAGNLSEQDELSFSRWSELFTSITADQQATADCCIYGEDDSDPRKVDLVTSCRGRLVEKDKSPKYVIRFTDFYTDSNAAEEATMVKQIFPESTVIVIAPESVTGNEKEKLLYRLMLLDSLYKKVGLERIYRAAAELGAGGYYPYIYE